jgi:NAD(P)H-hydrate epimerase
MAVKSDPSGFPQRKISEVPLVSASQMREIQGVAQEEYSVDILQIMENGGRSAAELALAMLGGRGRGQRVVVLAGGGNKGGAGLCAARALANWGCTVQPVFAEVESEMSFIARRQIQILRSAGIVDPSDEEVSEYTVEQQLAAADLVIDALIGYGLQGSPSGMASAVVELALLSRKPILALDVPTGVNASTGDIGTPAIKAMTTLTLDLPKKGIVTPEARSHVGELYLADIGIPRVVHQRLGIRIEGVYNDGPIVRLRR